MNYVQHHEWMQADIDWFKMNLLRSFRYHTVPIDTAAALTGTDLSRVDPKILQMMSGEPQLLIVYLSSGGKNCGLVRYTWALGIKVATLQANPEVLRTDQLAINLMRRDDVLVPPVDQMTVILRDPNASFGRAVV